MSMTTKLEEALHGQRVLAHEIEALKAELEEARAELRERVAGLEAQQSAPAGYVLVPVEPTPEMLRAAEEAYMPFGDMDIALRMAILSATSAPATVQGDGWIPVSERLPDVEQRLDEPCEIEGKPLPPLNITSTVQCFDGKRVFADAVEWFDGGQPMKGVTHWKPLDAAPAAIAAAQEGG